MKTIICPDCGQARSVKRIKDLLCRSCSRTRLLKRDGLWVNEESTKIAIDMIKKHIPYPEIARHIATSSSTICRIAKKIGYTPPVKTWDWMAIKDFYFKHGSVDKTLKTFSIPRYLWWKMRKNGTIPPRQIRGDVYQHLKKGTDPDRRYIKRRLIELGVFKNQCSICGISAWQNKPITLQLDHINGYNSDNRLENLRLICPNCHSQTETFSGKNRKTKSPEEFSGMGNDGRRKYSPKDTPG